MSHHTAHLRPVPQFAHVAITLRLADAGDDLLVRHVRLLRDCVALAQQRWGFEIDAAVVLPNEVQLLCAFSDVAFEVRSAVQLITAAFVRHLPDSASAIWSDDSEVYEIAPAVVALRRAFIENAPVRAGLANTPQDWPFSSAQADGAQGSNMGAAVA